MGEEKRCPQCGAALGADAPEGLCPACLVRLAASALPLPSPAEAETVLAVPDEAGLRFGRYTTIRMLGEGGMGIVYLARQDEPIRRTVALKVIKPGMDSKLVMGRFESERQALALMDHPNIAMVFDAGAAEDGRPYFVMEYVDGVPITDYCDANRLNNRERLELFRQVCLAVHHAHQKGVIHRDIKPSNVLVETRDGKPVPKVIDFGVAKAVNRRLTEQTMFTGHGLLVGTPEYMSPEQADLSNADVDTASDVYSLGMLLYELLAGALPFDWKRLRRAGYVEMMRIIREEEATPLHSKFKTLGVAATEVARRHNTDAMALERHLRGDLEWITMRAIEKDRKRRYASASELAADIERHLNDEPVSAGPPSRLYRMEKFVRKNRLPVAAAAAVLVCLIAGVTSSTILYFKEQQQRDRAERESYFANLANADALIESCDYGGARERLYQCAPRLRGWEWRMLFARTDTTVATLQGTGDPQMKFPGGGHFAFHTETGRAYYTMRRTVHAWDSGSWQRVGDFGVFGEVVGISADGSRIVSFHSAEGKSELTVMEPATGKAVSRLTEQPGTEWAAFSLDGTLVATGSSDGVVRVSEAETGKAVSMAAAVGPARQYAYPRMSFSPDGRSLASSAQMKVRMLDARTGKPLWTQTPGRGAIFSIAVSPDGNGVAVAQINDVFILDGKSGETKVKWREEDAVFSLAFSPDGALLASAAQNGAVRLWEAATGRQVATLSGHGSARVVSFSRDGKWLLGASPTGKIDVWNTAASGGSMLLFSSSSPRSLDVSPDGRSIAATVGGRLVVLDADSGRMRWEGPKATAYAVDYSPGGERLASGQGDGSVRILEAQTGKEIRTWSGHRGMIRSIEFSPDGRLICTGSADGAAVVWEAETGRSVVTLRAEDGVYKAMFSPDGKRVATAAGRPGLGGILDGLRVWEIPSGKLVFKYSYEAGVPEAVGALAYSPDGKLLASVVSTGFVRVLDASTGKLLAAMKGHSPHAMLAVVFSPDGRLIASASRDNTVRIWSVERYELLFTMRRPVVPASDLEFSPDGKTLYAAYSDNTLRAWKTGSRYSAEASEMAASLIRKHRFWADVRDQLAKDGSIEDRVRNEVLRAGAEGSDWGTEGLETLWASHLRRPDNEKAAQTLLRRAEDFHRNSPWSTTAWTILGSALYRNGRYQDALPHLKRSSDKAQEPDNEAYLAMTCQRLRQWDEAKAALQRAHGYAKTAPPLTRQESAPLITEAESLLAGQNK